MNFFMQIDLNLYACMLLILLLFGYSPGDGRRLLMNRLYRLMVMATLSIMVLDTIGWSLEGNTAPGLITLNWITSTLGCMLNPVPAYLWLLYADNQISGDDRHTLKLAVPAAIPAVLSALLSLMSPLGGILFTIDVSNRFQRGPFFFVLAIMLFGYLVSAFAFVGLHRKAVSARKFYPLFLFMLPPLIGGVIQLCLYGVTLIWAGMALSMLVLQLYLQHHTLRTDYLTGLYNRRQLDRYIRTRIDSHRLGNTFGALMLDIDNFKAINDTYGHPAGDTALEEMSKVLQHSFHQDDFIARYAGDEFVIVLDANAPEDFDRIVLRLRDTLHRYNLSTVQPYKLDVSLGYALYDPQAGLTADQFLKLIDDRMYLDKRMKKQRQTAFPEGIFLDGSISVADADCSFPLHHPTRAI